MKTTTPLETLSLADSAYKAIRQRFTTQVVLDRAQLIIDVKYLDGPFRRLVLPQRRRQPHEHSGDDWKRRRCNQ